MSQSQESLLSYQQQHQKIQQVFTKLMKENKLHVLEMKMNSDKTKSILNKLFRNMDIIIKLEDIPDNYKIFLYIPIVQEHHPGSRLYTFYVRMSTPQNKTIIIWKFNVNLSARILHSLINSNKFIEPYQMKQVQHNVQSQQLEKLSRQIRTKKATPENIVERLEFLENKVNKLINFCKNF